MRIKFYLIVVIVCLMAFGSLVISIFGWEESISKIRQEIGVIGRIIQIKLIEKKIVVGVTTRREFEELFNAQLVGGIYDFSCSSSTYCQSDKVLLRVEFETKSDNPSWSCSPNAKIVAPIVIERGICATD